MTGMSSDLSLRFEGSRLLIQRGQELTTIFRSQHRHIGAEFELTDAVIGQAGVGIDSHGIVNRAKPTRSLAMRLLDEARSAIGNNGHHGHIRGQRASATTQRGEHRSIIWPIVRQRRTAIGAVVAGQKKVGSRGVIDIVVRHRTNDGKAIRAIGQTRQVLADSQAWNPRWYADRFAAEFLRRIRLGIPCILMGRPAPHEQDDARFRTTGPGSRIRMRTLFKKVRERQSHQRQRSQT